MSTSRPAPGSGDLPATYTSSVIAPAQIGLGIVFGAVVGLILEALDTDLWPVSIIVFVASTVTGWYLAPVGLHVEGMRVTLGQGRGEKEPRVVYATEVRDIEARTLSWPQCFGIGLDHGDDAARTTRLSVRRGPTLLLTLVDGEQVRISTPDPDTAGELIDRARRSV